MFLLFLFGEGLNPLVLSVPDLVVLSLRLTACAGLLLAWRWEALGGGIAVGCMLAATILRPWVPGMALGLTLPGILFLLSWFLRRRERDRDVLPMKLC